MSTAAQVSFDVKNLELADAGRKRIDWANQSMQVLQIIRKEFIKNQPLKGVRISACLHVTAETANLAITLRDGGAEVVLCASNPLSTQDDVAAALVRECGIPVFAIKGEDNETYYKHIMAALDHKPQITMDDGADLVTTALTKRKDVLPGIIGGTEETTTGVIRLRAMAKEGVLRLSHHRRQRRRYQAPVRQPLWHRPVHHRRHRARHQFPAGGLQVRGGRLRLVRPRTGQPRPRPGRRSHRHRGRSHQGAGSGHGRLPRHGHGGRRPVSATSSAPSPETRACCARSISR